MLTPEQMQEIQLLIGDNSRLSDFSRDAVQALYDFAQDIDMELAELSLQLGRAQDEIASLRKHSVALQQELATARMYSTVPPKFGSEGYADWAAAREDREWQEQKRSES